MGQFSNPVATHPPVQLKLKCPPGVMGLLFGSAGAHTCPKSGQLAPNSSQSHCQRDKPAFVWTSAFFCPTKFNLLEWHQSYVAIWKQLASTKTFGLAIVNTRCHKLIKRSPLYKLYAVPVRICITRESYHQYPWVISSVPVRVCITRESYHQYLWVISSVPVRICSTREDMHYPWGKFHSFFIHINLLTGTAYPHGYWGYDSWVLHILMGTEDMTHGYWWYDSWVLHILTGTEDMTHGYCISSRVLRIWLTGTDDMTQGYCISSWVLRIWLTGTEDMTHGYCISSQVLRIWLMGTDDMTHG